jgi:DNA repair exonuclease SbcCD ATPase subunit
MKIKYLILKNFRTVTEAKLDFRSGINLITGNNGQGKSTVIYALSLLLFDYCSGKLEDLIQWGKDHFYLEIEFEHKGKIFKETLYYDTGSKRELYVNSDFYKNSDACKVLAEYFDPKLSLASVISFEGEIDLIQSKPSERRDHLKKIYDLDFKEGINALDLEMKEIVDVKLPEIEKKIYALQKKEYAFKEDEKLPFEKDLKETKEKDLEHLIQLKANYDLKLKEYENSIKSINERKENVKKYEKLILDSKTKVNKLESDHQVNHENLDKDSLKNQEKIDLYKKELQKDFEIELSRIRKEKESIVLVRIKAFDESLLKEQIQKESDYKSQIKEIDSKLKLCESGKCPTCQKDFDSNDISSYKNEKDNLNIALRDVQFEIERLEKEKTDYVKAVEDQNELKLKLEGLKSAEEKEAQKIETQKKDLNDKIASLEKDILNDQKMHDEKQKNIKENITSENLSIVSNMEELARNNEELTKLEKEIPLEKPTIKSETLEEISVIQEELKSYEKVIIINAQNKIHNEKLTEEQSKDSITKENFTKEKDSLNEEVEELKKGKAILQKEFPNYVISTLTNTLERNLNEFIEKTYEGRYKLKIIDKKDSIYVVYGEKEKDVSLSSGYEKQIFGLAWKYALCKIQQVNFILLDEIDSQASPENSQKLFNVLGNLKELFGQMIIITHKTETQEILETEFNAKIFTAKDNTIY